MLGWVTPIAVYLAIGAIIWRAAWWASGVNKDLAALKTDVSELKTDVSELKTDVSELKTDVGNLKTDVGNLKTDVGFLKRAVEVILHRLGGPITTEGQSPVRLTERGEEFAKAIEAERGAKELAPGLLSRAEGKEPYQIEEIARDYVEQELPEAWVARIAREAYRTGALKPDIQAVLWVLLRDELLRLTGQPLDS